MLQYVCEFPPASCLTAAGARALFAVLKASRGARTAVVSEPRDRDEEEEAVCGGLLPRLETGPAAQVRPAFVFKLHMFVTTVIIRQGCELFFFLNLDSASESKLN